MRDVLRCDRVGCNGALELDDDVENFTAGLEGYSCSECDYVKRV